MNQLFSYIDENKERYVSELVEFLEIPSISSLTEHNEDTLSCANWVVDHIKSIGIENAHLVMTPGHPIVYAEWLEAGTDAPTILIYGHYDVQPVDPLELWTSPPFEPTIRDGKLFARGSSDDKGQVFVHLKAIEALFKTYGKLPVNIKLMIEGEEEAGSSNLETFIENNQEMLKCDTVLVSDTEWFADGLPSICYSLRGISFVEVKVIGPNRDLHSGTFGGAVDNPINVLAWMISQLKDRYGRITIPGFYDDVVDLTIEEREGFKELPFDLEEYKKDLDIKELHGEIGYTTLERTWARPSLDLNGIKGGFIGEGAKTVLPSEASAKISMRLVANQTADDITKKILDYLVKLAPPTVKVEVKELHGGNPVLVQRDGKAISTAMEALEMAFGQKPVFMREGGSIPIVEKFESILKAPTVLMGLGLPGDNIHSPNENFDLKNYIGGIAASAIFLKNIAE